MLFSLSLLRVPISLIPFAGLVPDHLIVQVILEKLDSLRGQHWVLDGFPRTLPQGKLLDGHLSQPLSLIVNLNVPDDVILSRIAGRLI